jgi:hypothetical protein
MGLLGLPSIITMNVKIILIIVALLISAAFVKNTYLSKSPSENLVPNPAATKTNPPVAYEKESTDRMLDLVDNRRKLSSSDLRVKEKLKKLLKTPKTTNTYTIEYVSNPDEFMVEILTIDMNTAKEESVAWLRNQGLSEQGLCNLPVVYYLNYNVAQNLRDMNIKFNPLAPGC